MRTPRDDLLRELEDLEFAREYGAATIKTELALLLGRLRQEHWLTTDEMAQALGITRSRYINLTRGDANPYLSEVGKLLATIGLRLKLSAEPLEGES